MALGFDTIGKKLFWSIGMPALLVTLGGVGLVWHEAQRAMQGATRSAAVRIADLVTAGWALPEPEGVPAHRAVRSFLASQEHLLGRVETARIVSPEGRVRWSLRPEEVGQVLPEAQRPQAAPPGEEAAADSPEVVRPLGAECAGCHAQSGDRMGVVQVRLGAPSLQRQVRSAFQGAAAAVLLFGAVVALALWLSLRFFIARPLARLAAVMRRAEAGDLVVRADTAGGDEIGRLGAAFNEMLARLTSMKAEEIDTQRDLAAAHEKLALQEALQHRLGELVLLSDVARSLSSTLELDELFSRITSLVTERMRIPRLSIMLLDAHATLEMKAAHPHQPDALGHTFRLGEGACGRAAETRQPIYIPDLADPHSLFLRRGPETRQPTGALLSLPMVHTGTVMGVLNFERPEVDSFSEVEMRLLAAVADLAAVAVKNARLHEETVALSVTDPLTGLPNRRQLFARLDLELARAKRFGTPVSVVMMDIDHFKHLNDSVGHLAGDQTLREVSEAMRHRVRKVDTLGRFGGEEFVVVLPQVSPAEAREAAEKLRRAVEETSFKYGAGQPGGRLTISLGVASCPADATDQDRLVDCADAALYAAKRAGRNRVVSYAPGMELDPGRKRGSAAQRRSGALQAPHAPLREG